MARLVPILAIVSACSSAPDTKAAIDASAAIDAIVLGHKSTECRTAADCASGVCSMHACVPLVAVNEAWMEAIMAGKLRALIADDAAARTTLARTLTELVEGPDAYTQAHVAGLLGELGDAAFVPQLRALAESPIELVAVRARIALGRLADDASFAPVLALLAHASEAVVLQSAEAVAAYAHTAEADKAVSALLGLLDHDAYRVRLRAVRLLGTTGEPRPPVIEALERLLRSEANGYLQQDAFKAIVTLDPSRYDRASELIKP